MLSTAFVAQGWNALAGSIRRLQPGASNGIMSPKLKDMEGTGVAGGALELGPPPGQRRQAKVKGSRVMPTFNTDT